jgi:hypothetical protein
MLNLNYNIIGGTEPNRFSKQQDKGFIPFQVQYLVVAGGGGSAGGGNLKAGQAGFGGQILQGGYCVQPFATYSINIGQGGIGGAVSGSLTITTGSVGQTSSFATITASGGQGGVYQNAVTLSFFGGAGNNGVYPPSNGNGGSGSQWVYNLGGGPLCYPPFGSCGEYITSSYYAGGGAGFIIGPPEIQYMIIGGGGGGANTGGGWGGEWNLGSFLAYPSESYSIGIGQGGKNATNAGYPDSFGFVGTASFISGSNVTTPLFVTASGGRGGIGIGAPGSSTGGGVGGGVYPYTSSNTQNGANGIQWLDGFYYGGGGGASRENPNPGNGIGGYGGGSNGGGSTSTGSFGGNDQTNYPFGIYSGPPGYPSGQVNRSDFGNGMGAGGSGLRGASGPTQNFISGSGGNGTVVLRYSGTPIATGGEIVTSGSYTYHYFASSSTFNTTLSELLIRPGAPGDSGAVTGSNAADNTGGGGGGSFYNISGSKGGSGFVALRYEGAPIAEGGQIIGTDHYTYHIYTASGEFYAIGNETNPNINPCP